MVVDFEPSKASHIFMDLIVKNTGSTLATNVDISFEPELASTLTSEGDRYRLSESAILTQGIPTLPPNREYRMLFERMPDRYESDLPRSYLAMVKFDDPRGRNHTLEYRLDLDIYFGVTKLSIYGEHDAAKALREIERTMRKWVGSGDSPEVWVRDGDARVERERQEYEAWIEGRRARPDDPPTSDDAEGAT